MRIPVKQLAIAEPNVERFDRGYFISRLVWGALFVKMAQVERIQKLVQQSELAWHGILLGKAHFNTIITLLLVDTRKHQY